MPVSHQNNSGYQRPNGLEYIKKNYVKKDSSFHVKKRKEVR